MAGYHKKDILKGVVGKPSKIREEFEEFMDAIESDNEIMALMELSDMYLAMMRYLEHTHPSFNMGHIHNMAMTTKRAFDSGGRK
jgi:hypothetical protein